MADYSDTIEDAGRRFNVEPALIRAVMMAESGGDPKARSRAGATGLMQIMPDTARRLGVDASDPVQSIYGAANLLSQHLDHYGNVPDACAPIMGALIGRIGPMPKQALTQGAWHLFIRPPLAPKAPLTWLRNRKSRSRPA
ncbi:lytic transglycosylase domain-containing protein [Asaia prunellae]|uniref:lytic transglycosylase domain-containing protein n=1 Tax=Asaia prunellae TaxID=610245 RepID=UPI00046FC2E7|nr:lytic transglycosylase domain-containing protein [Asaia prunellae]